MNKLNHVAFIMDGNGRWGKKRNKSRNFGHMNGVKTVKKIVSASLKIKIPIITFFVFSTENWKRPKSEIKFLFNLVKSYFEKESIISNGIRINIIGNSSNLPKFLREILKKVTKSTNKNKKIIVNLALNYGSKEEIKSSFMQIFKNNEKITVSNIKKNLYTKKIPDPDILVRTGGQKRLSNFMLWQLAYAEIYFINKLWPDFDITDLNKIIKNFRTIKRNFGKI